LLISKRFVASILFSVVSATFLFGATANADVGEVEVGRLLDSMSRALREQNYRGIFTYEYGGMLETLKLTHQVDKNREYEKIEHLNGVQRIYQRQGLKPECESAAEQVLRVSSMANSIGASAPNQYYHYYLRNVQRVAGRQVQVVQLLPKDQYRYGHIISIDQVSSLPLVNMIVSPQRRVLERIQFTNIEVSDTPVGMNLFSVNDAEYNDECTSVGTNDFAWMINWLPPGFILVQHSEHSDVGESLSYTDGLASFSVFVRPNSAVTSQTGVAQKGASIALLRPLMIGSESFQVSVVGEIPGHTADKVASSISIKPLSANVGSQ
jgi:sigma-E factor negative regulatory protein RseB